MPMRGRLLPTALLLICLCASKSSAADNRFIAENDVTWPSLGTNENDSMPLGNGDLAANVWTEQNGDVLLLVAKADAWSETGKILKLGRVRIQITPNPFVDSAAFSQNLRVEDGEIEIKSGGNEMRIWIDANHPVLHIETHLASPATLAARSEIWRATAHSYDTPSPDRGGLFEFGDHSEFGDRSIPFPFGADTVLPAGSDCLTWCHFNSNTVYPLVFQKEHLDSLLPEFPDPLLHRCFGALMTGPGLVSDGNRVLKSAGMANDFRIDLYALTQTGCASPSSWQTTMDAQVEHLKQLDLNEARKAHVQWWNEFWNRSWIHVEGAPDATKVSQGYCMQRWMMACSSRGEEPAKFNGSLFTVGHDMPEGRDSTPADHNPDFRQWGSCFWNQNNRLLYWPLIATGDDDLLKPWFDMYLNALPLARRRTQLYFHHEGAAFVETMYFWGLPNLNDFGWDNTSNVLQSAWMRYHIQGALEVVAQMLDRYDYTQDAGFARASLVPFADAIVTYYDQHWSREANGKIRMSPVQSLETYQRDAVNPTPDIAGLDSVLPRLLDLPGDLASPGQRQLWAKVLRDLPPIPMGKTHQGKMPPAGQGDPDGAATILPAEKYGQPRNAENPELYTAFPYRLYGVGKPGLELARATYEARKYPFKDCWGQDGTESAVLGLTDEAKTTVVREFTDYGPQRYRWFWKAGGDWIPDLDDGGSGMITLQLMLLQCDGRRIQLLPAWPSNWTADFKLLAPYRTTVECHVAGGKITKLQVTPESRSGDVVLVSSPITK
jgi:alpha-L-fucosidase 2